MKKLLPLVFLFQVGNGFDFDAFLVAARVNGIALGAQTESDTVNGSATLSGEVLAVDLVETTQLAVVGKRAHESRVGFAPLAAPLSQHKTKLEAAIKAAGGR